MTVNFAAALVLKGHVGRVGILDADIHGPCVPRMSGMEGRRLEGGLPGVFLAFGPLNIKVVSMEFLLPSADSPVIWRGPLKIAAIRQFLSEIVWGDLDYLLIDLPPGPETNPSAPSSFCPIWMPSYWGPSPARSLRGL